jgi:hypothetical protein
MTKREREREIARLQRLIMEEGDDGIFLDADERARIVDQLIPLLGKARVIAVLELGIARVKAQKAKLVDGLARRGERVPGLLQ